VGEKLKLEEVIEEAVSAQDDVHPGFREACEASTGIHHYPLWHHPYVMERVPIKSNTIDNLYFVGDSTKPQIGMGMDAACNTGIFLTEMLLDIEIGQWAR
jgi:hypothetical protein